MGSLPDLRTNLGFYIVQGLVVLITIATDYAAAYGTRNSGSLLHWRYFRPGLAHYPGPWV